MFVHDSKLIDLRDYKSYDLESFVSGELNDIIKLMLTSNNDSNNIVCYIKLDNVPGYINGAMFPLCDWLYTKKEDSLWDTYNFDHSFVEDNVVFDFTNDRLVFINTDLDVTLNYIRNALYFNLYFELCDYNEDDPELGSKKAFDFVCNRGYEGNIHLYLYENNNILWM